jgi:hypothetical protein
MSPDAGRAPAQMPEAYPHGQSGDAGWKVALQSVRPHMRAGSPRSNLLPDGGAGAAGEVCDTGYRRVGLAGASKESVPALVMVVRWMTDGDRRVARLCGDAIEHRALPPDRLEGSDL